MESIKKWLAERTTKKDGIYLHYSPPKLVGATSEAQLRLWARGGGVSRLERAVLAGQGRRLLAAAEALPLAHHLPALVARCDALHAAVERGSLAELQELLDSDFNRRKYLMCRDEAGVGLLHKAVFYDFMDIATWLVAQSPELVHEKDSAGRTPLHYAAVCRDEAFAAALLEGAGAARGARDAAGRTPAHYRGAARTQLALPTPDDMPPNNPKNTGLVIKRHNIRIWCHDCDMARLQRVVWEGHGSRLLSEVSSQPVVKKFLEAVPYIMNTVRDIHSAVIENDLEALMKHSGDPVPPQALSSRDSNNMTVLHKAAGLGHGGILRYIVDRYPQGINDVDNDGRTPLHYAAAVRDDQHTYNTLVEYGADENITDNKNKPAKFYTNRPQDIDRNNFKTLPDAPRTASSAYPSSWDWKLLDTEVIAELNKKSRKKNAKSSSENVSSKNNTQTISESTDNHIGMKTSSTREFIKDLPDLDTKAGSQVNQESEVNDDHVDVAQSSDKESIENENEENDEPNIEENKKDDEVTAGYDNIAENDDEENKNENEGKDGNDDYEDKISSHNPDEESETKNSQNFESEPEAINEEDADTQKVENEEIENLDNGDTQNNGEPSSENDTTENNDDTNHKEEIEKIPETEEPEQKEEEQNDAEESGDNPDNPEEDNDNQNDNKSHVNDIVEEPISTANEGNYSSEHSEDDNDVQVQGDSHSDYSDINHQSTADLFEMERAQRGNVSDGRNTQDSLIEGIISGEAEQDSQDANIIRNGSVHGEILVVDYEIDPEVTELINNTNMEMLATLVLNGEGSRLVGRQSGNSELQAFLDNVPTYMQKINKVHVAAREGNIRDLQAALDRRKFAIARDAISANGATPLHVATIFGKTNIMKYLGGRFPETLSAVDFEGRSALHYAAVLPDNGHYYNLLQQLGANSKDLDDSGRSAEEYYKNPNLLPHNQLLSDYGLSEAAVQEMFADKVPEDRVSSRRALDMPEVLDTLERCYRLLSSATPVRTPISASSNRTTPSLVLGRFLKRPVFDAIKYRITKLDHDLFDVIWPAVKKLPDNRNIIQIVEEDFPGGVTAPDYYVYEVFHEFFAPLLKDIHNINVHSELPIHPPSEFVKLSNKSSTVSSEPLIELNIDPSDEFALSGMIECSRNLVGFELPLNLKIGQLESIERIITTLLMHEKFAKLTETLNAESDQKGGSYYTLNEVMEKPSEICAALASSGLLIALCDKDEIDDSTRLHGNHWPYGRGVFVNEDKTLAIWINVHDHLRVVISNPVDSPGEIGLPFSKITLIMAYLHEKLDFVWDQKLGHLSSRPTFLGAGLRFSLIVNFPGLSKDPDNIKHLCAMRGLQYRESLSTDIARISNYQCLSTTETNCFNDFATAASNLLHLEKDLAMQNSAHIATMLSNIFKRKRSSLADIDNADHP